MAIEFPLRSFCIGLAAALVASAAAIASPPTLAIRWSHRADGWGEPLIQGSLAFFLTRQHEVVALEAATGTLRWRVTTGGEGDAPWGSVIRSAGTAVIVGDGAIVALDQASGHSLWRFTTGDHAVGPFLGDADEAAILVGSAEGTVRAIDPANGRQLWTRRLDDAAQTIVFAPVFGGDAVVVAYRRQAPTVAGGVAVFDRQGRLLWQRTLPWGVGATGPAAPVGGVVAVAGTDGTIVCWDARTGLQRGTLPSLGDRSNDVRPLTAAGDRLVAGSLTGTVTAFDVSTLREISRYTPVDTTATLRLRTDGSTVLVSFTDDTVVALDVATGQERWRIGGSSEPIEWPPAATADAIYAAGTHALIAWSRPSATPDRDESLHP